MSQLAAKLFEKPAEARVEGGENVNGSLGTIAQAIFNSRFVREIGAELKDKTSHGSLEVASALFGHSGFVQYGAGRTEGVAEQHQHDVSHGR